MIDTHAHLNLKDFDVDRSKVAASCQELGIEIINIGIDRESSVRAIEIARSYKGFYASVGLHPNAHKKSLKMIEHLIEDEKVVAIGETGLDFYRSGRNRNDIKRQKDLMIEHGKLSARSKKPLIIHCRQAYQELISLLYNELRESWGVIHSFSGSLDNARELLNLGYYLGFSGLIFKANLDEVIRSTPLDRILVETDSPYLPPPSIETKRNAPHIGLLPVIEKIAFVKKIPSAEIISATVNNAVCLFKLNEHGRI